MRYIYFCSSPCWPSRAMCFCLDPPCRCGMDGCACVRIFPVIFDAIGVPSYIPLSLPFKWDERGVFPTLIKVMEVHGCINLERHRIDPWICILAARCPPNVGQDVPKTWNAGICVHTILSNKNMSFITGLLDSSHIIVCKLKRGQGMTGCIVG